MRKLSISNDYVVFCNSDQYKAAGKSPDVDCGSTRRGIPLAAGDCRFSFFLNNSTVVLIISYLIKIENLYYHHCVVIR